MSGVTVRLMSDGELSRLEVLRDLDQRRLTAAAAAQLLGLERRQVFRLLKAYRAEGATGLISKRRGRPSNRRKPEALRDQGAGDHSRAVLGFRPTLAAEKLREVHGIAFGRETLRLWMIADGLWADRKQRLKAHPSAALSARVRRRTGADRRLRAWWFEDRGPQCTLLVFVDDATSRLMHLQFVESESTFAYFHATRAYLEAWGKPVAFYSDKHGVFRVNHDGGDRRRRHDPVRPGFACAQHRHHLRQFEPGQGSGRAGAQDLAGPTGQGAAARRRVQPGRGECPAPGLHGRLQRALCQSAGQRQGFARPLHAGDDLEDAFAWKEERTLSRR